MKLYQLCEETQNLTNFSKFKELSKTNTFNSIISARIPKKWLGWLRVQQFQKVHGKSKYVYESFEKVGNGTVINVKCKIHDVIFSQSVYSHLSGKGCYKCGLEKNRKLNSLSFDDFVKRSITVHKNKYKYDKNTYTNASSATSIICPTHGEFKQKPEKHMIGQGCKICNNTRIFNVNKERINITILLEVYNKTHENKYDYSSFVYSGYKKHSIIVCPVHGEFKQTPSSHLTSGCPKCAIDNNKISQKEFVERANKIHYDKYKYDNIVYDKLGTKVMITCPIHGDFEQKAQTHLSGHGCPRCSSSKGEEKITYFLLNKEIAFVREKKFHKLGSLRFDFYLPDYNLCIEYDGIHHFVSVDRFKSGKTDLAQIKARDEKKNQFCFENNIKLIRIPYTDYNNIEKILTQGIYNG